MTKQDETVMQIMTSSRIDEYADPSQIHTRVVYCSDSSRQSNMVYPENAKNAAELACMSKTATQTVADTDTKVSKDRNESKPNSLRSRDASSL